jgi:hypothetical protein
MTFEEWLSRTIPLDPAQQMVAKCAWDAAIKAKLESEQVGYVRVGYVRGEDLERMKKGTSSAWLYSVPSGIASFAIPLYRKEDVI